jgi:hypothetical protein
MAAAGAGAAAAAAAIARAIKASGVIVQVEPEVFMQLLLRATDPLVVQAEGGFFKTKHMYLTSYKGLAFAARSDELLPLPANTELILAEKIWIPDSF